MCRLFLFVILSAGNVSRTKAAGADIHSLHFAVNNNANSLDIWLPGSLCFQVGVGYVHTGHSFLSAGFTITCHVLHLLHLP